MPSIWYSTPGGEEEIQVLLQVLMHSIKLGTMYSWMFRRCLLVLEPMEDVFLDLLELITILLTMAGTSFYKLMSPRIISYIMQ